MSVNDILIIETFESKGTKRRVVTFWRGRLHFCNFNSASYVMLPCQHQQIHHSVSSLNSANPGHQTWGYDIRSWIPPPTIKLRSPSWLLVGFFLSGITMPDLALNKCGYSILLKKKKKTERKGGTEVMDLERGDNNFKAHMLQQIRCTLVHRREFSNWAS